ncbi:MAG: hypothetical protein HOV81_36645 [Kofleriaceae bacterium]|nr:hypothetical protein [Kofleriaceae bacterium]
MSVERILSELAGVDRDQRGATLCGIAEGDTTGDPRVIDKLESMLADTEVVSYVPRETTARAEQRLIAALALAAERWANGSRMPVAVRSLPAVRNVSDVYYRQLVADGSLSERDYSLGFNEPPETYVIDAPRPEPARMTPAPRAEDILARLEGNDVRARVNVLSMLRTPGPLDPRIRAAVEALLDDRSIGALTIPYLYGEVRVLAAAVLAAADHASGADAPQRLRAPALYSSTELLELGQAARLSPHLRTEELFAKLRALGVIRERDLAIGFPAHLGWIRR